MDIERHQKLHATLREAFLVAVNTNEGLFPRLLKVIELLSDAIVILEEEESNESNC